MREIKFRAWGKRAGMMYNIAVLRFFKKLERVGLFHNDFQYNGFIQVDISLIELMQFTGLKDKDGKEIFEGDIVKCEVEHRGNFIIQEIKDIKWDYPNAISVIDNVYQVEVIGNIYGNPELLELLGENKK